MYVRGLYLGTIKRERWGKGRGSQEAPFWVTLVQCVLRKGSGEFESAVDTVYNIYLSLCTHTTYPNYPNTFRDTHCSFSLKIHDHALF